MCGIIAYIGNKPASRLILNGLKKLEYRGYDSAGIACLMADGIHAVHSVGDIATLSKKLFNHPLSGTTGIGHTRWATHGPATLKNTHPHTSGKVTLVHNGIIENYQELKQELMNEGVKFTSDTDSEIVAALVNKHYELSANILGAVSKTLALLRGSWALAIICTDQPDTIILARKSSPLLYACSSQSTLIGSDVTIFSDDQTVFELQDNQIALCTKDKVKVFTPQLKQAVAKKLPRSASESAPTLSGHDSFMHKEITEQPEIISRILRHYASVTALTLDRPYIFYGCGSAYHAGLAAQYMLETKTQFSIKSELASELRYSEAHLPANTAAVAISQSGETADTLSCNEALNARGVSSYALVNKTESSLARQSAHAYPVLAGVEVSVASTKAFTAQLLSLQLLFNPLVAADLKDLPEHIEKILSIEKTIQHAAKKIGHHSFGLVLARGPLYPIALETALKIREITYMPCFGIPTGEMKHGTHALLSDKSLVIFFLAKGDLFEKYLSSLAEVQARTNSVLVITDEETFVPNEPVTTVRLPFYNTASQQFAFAVAGQMLSYHMAKSLGRNIDRPRNLAKSVTVE